VIAENFVPTTPSEAYKAIIDQLANETTRSISTKLIAEQGILSESPDEGVANEFVRSLSAEHRRILAHIVHRERVGASTMCWHYSHRGSQLAVSALPCTVSRCPSN